MHGTNWIFSTSTLNAYSNYDKLNGVNRQKSALYISIYPLLDHLLYVYELNGKFHHFKYFGMWWC